jgi:hypothetical protein
MGAIEMASPLRRPGSGCESSSDDTSYAAEILRNWILGFRQAGVTEYFWTWV